MKIKIVLGFAMLLIIVAFTYAQDNTIKPPTPGDKFPDFTLPAYQGGEFSMQQMRGKNVLLIASRGKYSETGWCGICNYQYADFVSLATKDKIREKYNLEIVFIMPFSKETLTEWEKAFPQVMSQIEDWKHPSDTLNLTADQRGWMELCRKKFPEDYVPAEGLVDLPFPLLEDGDHSVSKGLDIFRTEWDGGKVAQNIPAVYIIDSEGILRFKYISQNTFDRPTSEYIISIIEKMIQ